ncbi:glycosyltransferase N-terminal domain-containing protein [Desulfatiferula olefinivorans]
MRESIAMTLLFFVYRLAWTLALPFLRRRPRLADGIDQRLLTGNGHGPADIWIQSASAGEAYLTADILAALDVAMPIRIRLTTATRQGFDILKQARQALRKIRPALDIDVSFTPFDRPDIMENAVDQIRPRLMVLVELEMWPGMLKALKNKGCPILIVNGRLTDRSLKRYLLFPGLWQALAPDEVCAMSDDDARRFESLFPNTPVRVVPNIKFDRVASDSTVTEVNPLAGLFPDDRPRVVLGSIREEEEEAVVDLIRTLIRQEPQVLVLLFPRHMHRVDAWTRRLTALDIRFRRRSDLDGKTDAGQVIVWDRFGELASAYALAQAAFVGGSLAPLGGQNFLEVLQSGLVPVCGPHWENFAWVGEAIVDKGLLILEPTGKKAAERLLIQIRNAVPRDRIRQRASDYLDTRKGGTRQTCARILAHFKG